MTSDAWEARLREDLPRGLAPRLRAPAGERTMEARWLTPAELTAKSWDAETGLLLGRREGRLVGWVDDRHVMTIAGSRSGKGVSLIVPNLLRYKGSALVVDPKGENAAITARRRREMGQHVCVLDPFGESGQSSASYNPLGHLDGNTSECLEDIDTMTDALIEHPERGERHWTESAKAVLRALMLLAVYDPNVSRRNLVAVRDMLMLTGERIGNVMTIQQKSEAKAEGRMTPQTALYKLLKDQVGQTHGHICAGVAEQLQAMSENERGSVLSAARTQTQWLDNDRMRKTLKISDFTLEDLKEKRTTIYLCLPSRHMGTHAKWLRLMVMQALAMMQKTRIRVEPPVLFVLDEFATLGHVDSIEKAAGLMAGYGVKLWPILQNVGQLKQHYERGWETFFANCGMVTAFGMADTETCKIVSEMLGQLTVTQRIASEVAYEQRVAGSSPSRDERREQPLLGAHELRLLFSRGLMRALAISVEHAPLVVERVDYRHEAMFVGQFDEWVGSVPGTS